MFSFLGYVFLFIPVKYVYDLIYNPPSEVYGENLKLDEWKTICLHGDPENGCSDEGYELITKSQIYFDKKRKDVVTKIEVDEYYEDLFITIKDWESGEIIQPYPQSNHKWYQFFKDYEEIDTVAGLLDIYWADSISYDITLFKDYILISDENFLNEYEKNDSTWYTMRVYFKNGEHLIVSL